MIGVVTTLSDAWEPSTIKMSVRLRASRLATAGNHVRRREPNGQHHLLG